MQQFSDALRAGWRGQLAAGLTRVLSRDISPETVLSSLVSLSGTALLALDFAIRERSSSYYLPPAFEDELRTDSAHGHTEEYFLFVAAAHRVRVVIQYVIAMNFPPE